MQSLGGLMYALKEAGELPPGPLYTAQLDVSYRAMIPAESQVRAAGLRACGLWRRPLAALSHTARPPAPTCRAAVRRCLLTAALAHVFMLSGYVSAALPRRCW